MALQTFFLARKAPATNIILAMKSWWQRRHEAHQDPINEDLESIKKVWKIGKRKTQRNEAPEIDVEQTNIYTTPSGTRIPKRSRGKRKRPRHPS